MPNDKTERTKIHKSQELLTSLHHTSYASVKISSSSDPMPPSIYSSYPTLPQDDQTLYHIEQTPTSLLT